MKKLGLLSLFIVSALTAGVIWHNYGDGVDVHLSVTATPTPDTLQAGRYLVQAGNCIACHTARGGAPLAGGRAIDTPFGAVFSSNLTPDPDTGLGRWNAQHFWRALHHGRSKDGRLLAPAFPYNHTTLITRSDADAMFAWLQSLPAVTQVTPPHQLHWPLGTQAALAVWRTLYFKAGIYQPQPQQDAAWNRGAYLVQGLGHCAACHSPRNALGATASWDDLSGGLMFGANWWAPSLTDPLQTALSETPTSAIVQLLKTGRSGEHHTTGPMGEVVQNSTQFLTDADLQAMAMYLQSTTQPAAQSQPNAVTPLQRILPNVATRGAKIYEQHCAQCHGEQGQGQAGAYPALAGHRAVLQKDTTNLVQTVLYGGYPPATAGNPRPFGMPPYILTLDDKDIAAVLTHVRTQWGNHAAEVTPLEVHRIRASQGS